MKHCKYCSKIHHENMFRNNRRKCKTCERGYGRKYGKENGDKRKKWRQENAQRMISLQSKWYEEHKREIRQKNKVRYHNDVNFKKMKNIMRVIQSTFKRKGECKYWNCSQEFFIKWLKFNDEMYSSLAQDHVIPRNKFNLVDKRGCLIEKNVRLCFSWFNVSPLLKRKNMAKHDEIDIEQIQQHIKRLKEFGYEVDPDYIDLCKEYITNTI